MGNSYFLTPTVVSHGHNGTVSLLMWQFFSATVAVTATDTIVTDRTKNLVK